MALQDIITAKENFEAAGTSDLLPAYMEAVVDFLGDIDIEGINEKIDELGEKIDDLDEKIDELDKKIDELEKRVEALEGD